MKPPPAAQQHEYSPQLATGVLDTPLSCICAVA